ncbi:hypothetical protein BOTBODRAFT_35672 [Botryobasidium botryosum FD-172 SS1]|uniref:Ubiquitin-like domain-containing protein n=1 Tax=Botryobasidium botryosum (strain FD-172 SS1) TaxID=930990 RepID=A0A067M5T0_BOTB1|nr:hypothetical protein BOTBODRAFT_35672 [Botryobasidium botryosum FD-172 SS1]
MSTRPRPRPRPRARPAIATNTSEPTASTSKSPTEKSPIGEVKDGGDADDVDAFFLRNHGPNKWKVIEEREKRLESAQPEVLEVEESDEEPTSPKKRRRGQSSRAKALPRWTQQPLRNFSSTTPDPSTIALISDEEEDSDAGPSSRVMARPKKRSRSRSLTPPPQMPAEQLLRARNAVMQTLGLEALPERSSSPTPDQAPAPSVDLSPELAAIAAQIKASAKQVDPSSLRTARGPEKVKVRVKWVDHPLMPRAQPLKTLAFMIKREDSFRELFNHSALRGGMARERLVMTYEGRLVFPGGTPDDLEIWDEAEFEAYESGAYEYIKAQRQAASEAPKKPTAEELDGIQEIMQEEDHVASRLKLSFRSARFTKPTTLSVKATATCASIVEKYLRAVDVKDVAKGKVHLEIDGEALDGESSIADADLEDGDLVEVIGL